MTAHDSPARNVRRIIQPTPHAGYDELVQWLLACGANPDVQDVFGDTYRHCLEGAC